MKIKEILAYIAGFIIGIVLSIQLLNEFNPYDLIAWFLLIPIAGFNIALLVHLIHRIRGKKK